jgi:hypothetical protein
MKTLILKELRENLKWVTLPGLAGLPLVRLELTVTQVSDLSPLKRMPLTDLQITYTPVTDLSPLKGMMIQVLNLDGTQVENLAPMEGQPLTHLHLRRTRVADLSPLKGMPLVYLAYKGTPVTDITPLKELRLKSVECDFQPARDAARRAAGAAVVWAFRGPAPCARQVTWTGVTSGPRPCACWRAPG